MKIHQCADRPNCGRVFRAYRGEYGHATICPYCGELAEIIE